MAKLTFLRVLKNNLKCALCAYTDCSVRYYPERKKIHYYEGIRYDICCKKDRENNGDILEKNLP